MKKKPLPIDPDLIIKPDLVSQHDFANTMLVVTMAAIVGTTILTGVALVHFMVRCSKGVAELRRIGMNVEALELNTRGFRPDMSTIKIGETATNVFACDKSALGHPDPDDKCTRESGRYVWGQ